jgi:hypothetical protein
MNTVFHIEHGYENNWSSLPLKEKNRIYYRENKKNNIVKIPINPSWGEF